jgi:hypothetical protein
MTDNLVETTGIHSHLLFIATPAFTLHELAGVLQRLRRKVRRTEKENVMTGRVMMILATALLAGSLLATGAQARGGGGFGGGGGHMGGGFGGGHIGSFGGGLGGGHMGGLGGGRIGAFSGDRMGGLGEDHVGSVGAGQIARVGHEHRGFGRRPLVGDDLDGYGTECPYYQTEYQPYCNYDY